MKRRDFFKNIGVLAAVSVAAPSILVSLDRPEAVERTFGNEGLWHQLRRGKVITYKEPGGITREHIADLYNDIIQGKHVLAVNGMDGCFTYDVSI